ncbi:hypothetical protein Sgleb_67060 [Streptomyces glebosus]|uniref:Uncharacterized protein n=1 Tax=Streptomyces glebosus TaxID=249580 RepID=A0A640T4K6_9ACTN|nr:hypothetical protein Sgleb_67060 [Streptomyces glebosus]
MQQMGGVDLPVAITGGSPAGRGYDRHELYGEPGLEVLRGGAVATTVRSTVLHSTHPTSP